MPHNHEWQSRIKTVEREYVAMRQAANRFCQAAITDPTILQENLRYGEILIAAERLEGSYVIRLFAEFESGARQYWHTNRATNPTTLNLLDGLAAKCRVPYLQLQNAHAVRDYRNSLVHERDDTCDKVAIAKARGFLCSFFSFLPPEWR